MATTAMRFGIGPCYFQSVSTTVETAAKVFNFCEKNKLWIDASSWPCIITNDGITNVIQQTCCSFDLFGCK